MLDRTLEKEAKFREGNLGLGRSTEESPGEGRSGEGSPGEGSSEKNKAQGKNKAQ